jgi:hypothetical protein
VRQMRIFAKVTDEQETPDPCPGGNTISLSGSGDRPKRRSMTRKNQTHVPKEIQYFFERKQRQVSRHKDTKQAHITNNP